MSLAAENMRHFREMYHVGYGATNSRHPRALPPLPWRPAGSMTAGG
jgi:hypothetical protein